MIVAILLIVVILAILLVVLIVAILLIVVILAILLVVLIVAIPLTVVILAILLRQFQTRLERIKRTRGLASIHIYIYIYIEREREREREREITCPFIYTERAIWNIYKRACKLLRNVSTMIYNLLMICLYIYIYI